jgi:hypothetical protein
MARRKCEPHRSLKMDSLASTGAGADDAVSISLPDIEAAAMRIKGIIRSTPLLESKTLARRFGGRVFIKSEGFQLTGSFKIRGIYNMLAQISAADRARGIVAHSAGNLGKSVAATAALFQAPCTIFMPMDAEPAKVASIRRLGADVVFYNRFQDDSKALSRCFVQQHRAFLVQRTANAQIISGHGTVGLEIADDFERRGVTPDLALVPCGSGGNGAKVAMALDRDRRLSAGGLSSYGSRARGQPLQRQCHNRLDLRCPYGCGWRKSGDCPYQGSVAGPQRRCGRPLDSSGSKNRRVEAETRDRAERGDSIGGTSGGSNQAQGPNRRNGPHRRQRRSKAPGASPEYAGRVETAQAAT